MKKFIFFLSIFLLFSTFLFAQEDDDDEIPEEEKIDLQAEYDCYTCYRAIQDGVNVRNEPNTHCKILGELSEGDEVSEIFSELMMDSISAMEEWW